MLAAENGGLPGGKVGGMGDVLRDLPRALVAAGARVTVLTPAHGFLARLPGARETGSLPVPFAGGVETCRRLELPGDVDGLRYELLDHARFAPGGREQIYVDDGAGAPFATDATKYAFFCAAAAELVAGLATKPDIVHLHDWHTGLYLLLRELSPRYRALKGIRSVFTIHNLAIQGIRPRSGSASSLERWYPSLAIPAGFGADPRYADCINPLAIAIRFADALSTVSPTYAREILVPGDGSAGRPGGESLEGLLGARAEAGALTGILNGCDYPERAPPKPSWKRFVEAVRETLAAWVAGGTTVDAAAWLAEKRLDELPKSRPPVLLTSVGRVNAQKLALMRQPVGRGLTALDRVLDALDRGLLIVLGSGDPDYELFLQQAMAAHPNLLFLKGYSDRLAEMLYTGGDLFLMPSSFEPCGISQMLAMRAGQPCVAHAVGGLRDTVTTENGFPFDGATPEQQARNFAREVGAAVDLKLSVPGRWQAVTAAARRARFSWAASAGRYLREVYAIEGGHGA